MIITISVVANTRFHFLESLAKVINDDTMKRLNNHEEIVDWRVMSIEGVHTMCCCNIT